MSVRDAIRSARTARWLRLCVSVGATPRLYGEPTLYASPGDIRIGDRFRLWSRPVASHLATGPEGTLEIGHDVAIGHGAAISAFERVMIGDRTCIGPYVVIMDTNFHGSTGDQSVQHDTKPISIGRGCRIGSRVTITRGAAIGDGAEILAGSVVSSQIPAGACAGGARARVLGHAGDRSCRWEGPAAVVPQLIRDVLQLDAAPDLDTDFSVLRWPGAGVEMLVTEIERLFGTTLDASTIRGARDLISIVAAVERGRDDARHG
jgi:acetyltransferase-like isoleucine patch superfamily enzyme